MGIRTNVQAGTFVTSPLGVRTQPANLTMEAFRTKLLIRY